MYDMKFAPTVLSLMFESSAGLDAAVWISSCTSDMFLPPKPVMCEELGRLRKLKMLVLSWQNDSAWTDNNAKISGSMRFFVIVFIYLRSKIAHFLSILSNYHTKIKLSPKKYA